MNCMNIVFSLLIKRGCERGKKLKFKRLIVDIQVFVIEYLIFEAFKNHELY